ncbi:hypothetical protein CGRA01v4_12128 [Colletotrichum graminicola]|nr:hypothetical protein CGRA01v4_12128 [Colletotrichum graminicola]
MACSKGCLLERGGFRFLCGILGSLSKKTLNQ